MLTELITRRVSGTGKPAENRERFRAADRAAHAGHRPLGGACVVAAARAGDGAGPTRCPSGLAGRLEETLGAAWDA